MNNGINLTNIQSKKICQLLLHSFLPSAGEILNASFKKKRDHQPACQWGLHMAARGVWLWGVLLHASSGHCWALAWQWLWVAHGSNPLSICVLSLPGINCYGWMARFCPSFCESFLNFESWLWHWQKFCIPISWEKLHCLFLSRLVLVAVSQIYIYNHSGVLVGIVWIWQLLR